MTSIDRAPGIKREMLEETGEARNANQLKECKEGRKKSLKLVLGTEVI